jgi:hypothetical protein
MNKKSNKQNKTKRLFYFLFVVAAAAALNGYFQ